MLRRDEPGGAWMAVMVARRRNWKRARVSLVRDDAMVMGRRREAGANQADHGHPSIAVIIELRWDGDLTMISLIQGLRRGGSEPRVSWHRHGARHRRGFVVLVIA